MATTGIEWTEVTWNPVTGCDRVSPGCDNCYALTLAKRLKAMGVRKYQVDGNAATSGPGFGVTIHPDTLAIPLKWRKPRMVFVNSMSDLFHARVPLWFVREVFSVMKATPQHTYQILTKRTRRLLRLSTQLEWPDNVWIGATVENESSRPRIDDLRSVPASVRFLSCEPLLTPLRGLNLEGLAWIIAGGESGPGARPVQEEWLIDLQQQAAAHGVAFFFKQWGGHTPKSGGRLLVGRTWDEMPNRIKPALMSKGKSHAG